MDLDFSLIWLIEVFLIIVFLILMFWVINLLDCVLKWNGVIVLVFDLIVRLFIVNMKDDCVLLLVV